MDPRSTYTTRLEHWKRIADASQREFITLGNARLVLVAVALLMAWLAFARQLFNPWWLVAPSVVFFVLARLLDRAERRQELARRATAHFEHGLARMDNTWMGKGTAGDNFRDAHHVYADDLDLFGSGSLFELLCIARTTSGERMLAHWLHNASSPDAVRARHEALKELAPRADLREELALLGEDVRAGVHSDALAAWGSEAHVTFPSWARPVCIFLAAVNFIAVAGHFSGWWSATPVLLGLSLALLAAFALREPTQQALAKVRSSARDLQILALLCERLEREEVRAQRLMELREQLRAQGQPVSHRIAQLGRLVEWIDSCNHIVLAILAPFLLLRPQLAISVERWRALNGPLIQRWMDVIGETEALNSLAAYAFEHPEAAYPELAQQPLPVFEARGLRHPLMSATQAVPNDVSLSDKMQLLIVSGSNMSGKSTLLRAIGLNCVLAWAGAPVAAACLRISPLALGASLRTVDSLQEGRSRFYAEILRLRQIMDLTSGDIPVLFLLDELLSGTNSHDRRIGAEAVLRGLVERGAIGLITTHDLALAQIVEALAGRAANCHFEDHLEDGKISFDYKLRPGVVQRSNALELMRAVGLQV